MLALQFAIGALNDVVDAPRDLVSKPRKPIPAGVVGGRLAIAVAGGGAVVGLGLSALSGPATAAVALAGLGLGWLYDLWLSRTSLAWLPLALALPLLPLHAWLGAAGVLPAGLMTLVPVGALAGAGLTLANGLVDIDRDASTRRAALVVRLGRHRTWLLQTVLLAGAATLGLALAPGGSAAASDRGATLAGSVGRTALALGFAGIALGAAVLASGSAGIRERGWELEALGVAGLGIGWLAGLSTLFGS